MYIKQLKKNYLSFLKCSFQASLKLAKESIHLILSARLFDNETALYKTAMACEWAAHWNLQHISVSSVAIVWLPIFL